MKERRLFVRNLIKLIVFIIFALPVSGFAEKTLIFVVDVSGSMRKSGIHKSVVNSLCTFIRNEFREGDNLILCSFGSSFYKNKQIFQGDSVQMKGFLPEIEKLNFRDDYTYMTLAFKEVAELADGIRKNYPNDPIFIYLYTDGKNEPPPFVSNPLTFEQIVEWYFGSYKNPQTHLYIITLGIKPEPNLKEFGEKVGAKITEVPVGPVPVPKLPYTIVISPQNLSYKSTSKSGRIEVNLSFDNKGDKDSIKIKVCVDNFTISPEEFVINKGENKVKFVIYYKDLSTKTYKASLTFSSQTSNIKFTPDKISVKITIYSLLPWFIGGIIVLILILFWLRCLFIPKFPHAYLVYLDKSGNVMTRFNLRSRQKFGSNKLRISDDIDVQGIMRGSFVLIAEKGGAVILKVIAKDKNVKFPATGMELRTGETKSLNPEDEFEFSGVRLKYEKGG